ncbi:MAG TPA: hypothetical protein VE439_02410 [Anaerolineae bacterium]|nr:hypothetical protein [Anaerolineae bacterium]
MKQTIKGAAPSGTQAKQRVRPQFFDARKVEWVTVTGGISPSKVLYQENAKTKIDKISNLINAAKGARPSKEDEMRPKYPRYSSWGPMLLEIRLTDGKTLSIGTCYDAAGSRSGHNKTADDRFIIHYKEDEKSITAYSRAVVKYLASGAFKDMPPTTGATTDKNAYTIGDSIKISGDGCTEPAVLLLLIKWEPNGKPGVTPPSYRLAQPKTHLGRWEWKGTVQKEFTTVDGKHVILDKGTYRYTVVPHSGLVYSVAEIVVD